MFSIASREIWAEFVNCVLWVHLEELAESGYAAQNISDLIACDAASLTRLSLGIEL